MSHRVAVGRSVVSSGDTAARAAQMASTNARADCAVSSTATRAEAPLGRIRKVDVQGVPRRCVHRVVVVDHRGAKREPAVASVAATRDRRLLGGVGAHASLQVLSVGATAGEEVAPAGSRPAKYAGPRRAGLPTGDPPRRGGPRRLAGGRGTPGRPIGRPAARGAVAVSYTHL